jgi:hypothetical protein
VRGESIPLSPSTPISTIEEKARNNFCQTPHNPKKNAEQSLITPINDTFVIHLVVAQNLIQALDTPLKKSIFLRKTIVR